MMSTWLLQRNNKKTFFTLRLELHQNANFKHLEIQQKRNFYAIQIRIEVSFRLQIQIKPSIPNILRYISFFLFPFFICK